MTATYQGHLSDGSSVQRHSAGGIYPFIVYARSISCATVYCVMSPGGREEIVGSHDAAVARAVQLKAQHTLH